jgi:hypothetical protein
MWFFHKDTKVQIKKETLIKFYKAKDVLVLMYEIKHGY